MTKLSDLEKKWKKDASFVKAFDALEDEFLVINTTMATRSNGKLRAATGTKLKISFEDIEKRGRR